MTGASSRISTPASRAARGVRQGETRRANLELTLLAAALVAFLLAVARVAAGHVIGAPGEAVDADVVRTWSGFAFALSRSAAIVTVAFLAAHVVRRLWGAVGDPWILPIVCALCGQEGDGDDGGGAAQREREPRPGADDVGVDGLAGCADDMAGGDARDGDEERDQHGRQQRELKVGAPGLALPDVACGPARRR